jgi:hypothetical protein
MKSFNSVVFILLLSSCGHLPPFKKIKVIHFTDDLYQKKDIGEIKVKHCKHDVGKYSTGYVNFDELFKKIQEKKGGISYIVNLKIDEDRINISDSKGNNIYSKECMILKGRGFK